MRLTLKLVFVVAMTLAILIPLSMIRSVISDRIQYRGQAVSDVARSYAGRQSFAGPMLVVPYTDVITVDGDERSAGGKNVKTTKQERVGGAWTFFPATLDVRGPMRPDTRKRGLHTVNVYEWRGHATAHFEVRIPDDVPASTKREIGQPFLSYAIGDVRGLRSAPKLRVNGEATNLEQGFGSREASGLHARLAAPAAGQELRLDTDLELLLGGTESLALVPLGKRSRFALQSSWQHPSFSGVSPNHTLDKNGFNAEWEIASVASEAQRQILDSAMRPRLTGGFGAEPAVESVGVALIDPVDIYTQTDRATKYGVLFVLLTFVGFFIFEMIKLLPIHPIQYGLVGLALAIFFLLLVSLSEHFEFVWAYLAASVACIGLLGFYLSAVLRSTVRGLGFAAMLALLYGALYGLLISEDNALVLGSGLLFAVLAAVMVITRKLDWYEYAAMPRMRRSGAAAKTAAG